eukprot:561588-Prymnesium_polylepis.1
MLWLWETIKSPVRTSRQDRARHHGAGCASTPAHIASEVHALASFGRLFRQGSQGVTEGHRGSQGVTGGTRGHKGSYGVTRGHKGHRGSHGVTE